MSHTYWRLRIWANNGDTDEITIAEVEFRASAGGADQATGGTALHDTGITGSTATGAASQAFDDNAATNWSLTAPTTNAFPYAIGYQFGGAVGVAQVAVTAPSATPSRCPRTFDVQWSDTGTAWETFWTETDSTGWTTGLTRTFTGPTFPAGVLATNLDGYAVTGTEIGAASSSLAGYAVPGAETHALATALAGYAVLAAPSSARPVINVTT